MGRCRWPNVEIEQTAELETELLNITFAASNLWKERSGGVGPRVPVAQPGVVRIAVDVDPEQVNLCRSVGKTCCGDAPRDVWLSRCGAPPPLPIPSQRKMSSARTPPPSGDGRRVPTEPALGEAVFSVPDYALVESPTLLELHRAAASTPCTDRRQHTRELVVLRRHVQPFAAVIALLKLRWLARLHRAVASSSAGQCSLVRYLKGALSDSCAVHEFPHSALPHFDNITETLSQRLDEAWPLFVAYVAAHADGPAEPQGRALLTPRGNLQADSRAPSKYSSTSTSPRNDFSEDSQLRTPRAILSSLGSEMTSCEQVVDDLWVAWVAQQPAADFPMDIVMEELDQFQMRRPTLRLSLDALRCWAAARPSTRYRYLRAAQVEAHHLAVILDMPSVWPEASHEREELLEMAATVVAHRASFGAALRARVAAGLDDDSHVSESAAPVASLARVLGEASMNHFQKCLSDSHDAGSLRPDRLERLRDSGRHWLVGGTARFADSARWHERALAALPGGAPAAAVSVGGSGFGGGAPLPSLSPRRSRA